MSSTTHAVWKCCGYQLAVKISDLSVLNVKYRPYSHHSFLTGPPLSESISHAKHSYVSNILTGQVRTAEVRRLEG